MDIAEAKKRVSELLSRITIRDNYDGDPYHHLEVDEWIELDTVKHELARQNGKAEFKYTMWYQNEISYCFDLGEGIANATLCYNVPSESISVEIQLVGDPSSDTVEGFLGDENQAWTLFHSLPVEEREEFHEFLQYHYRVIPEQVAVMIGDTAPEPGPNPAYLPRVTAPASTGPTP